MEELEDLLVEDIAAVGGEVLEGRRDHLLRLWILTETFLPVAGGSGARRRAPREAKMLVIRGRSSYFVLIAIASDRVPDDVRSG